MSPWKSRPEAVHPNRSRRSYRPTTILTFVSASSSTPGISVFRMGYGRFRCSVRFFCQMCFRIFLANSAAHNVNVPQRKGDCVERDDQRDEARHTSGRLRFHFQPQRTQRPLNRGGRHEVTPLLLLHQWGLLCLPLGPTPANGRRRTPVETAILPATFRPCRGQEVCRTENCACGRSVNCGRMAMFHHLPLGTGNRVHSGTPKCKLTRQRRI